MMYALIAAVLVTSMLTACGSTDTAKMTETSAKAEESVTTVSEETTTSISEATETTDETTETTTVVTEIQSALSEDVYGLDSAKSIDELNRGTYIAHYYSVNGNEVKHEMEQSFRGRIVDGFALEISIPQSYSSYLLFWNEEIGKYVAPCVERLSVEDTELIFDMLPIDDMDDEKIADMKDRGITVIGRKFFNIIYPKTFIYENGKFTEWKAEEDMPMSLGTYFYANVPEAVNFDYDKALKNLIPLTETSPAANKSDEY